MPKAFIAYIIVLIALAICAHREPGTPAREGGAARKALFWVHVVFGCLLTIYGVFHALSYFPTALLSSQVTGSAMLALLVAEVCIGCVAYFKKRTGLKRAHIVIAVLIVMLLATHLIVRAHM